VTGPGTPRGSAASQPGPPADPGQPGGMVQAEKRLAAEAAAGMVEAGMVLGLGTGSTVSYLLPALARRHLPLTCVATSPATAEAATALGLDVRPFTGIDRLDLAIDGADQVAPDGWLVKGGGGAHHRERIVAAAAERFVVIVSSDKLVATLHAPVPLELAAFGVDATLRALRSLGEVRRRPAPATPDGGVLADLVLDPVDPPALARLLDQQAGVVAHGLFPPELTSEVLVAQGTELHRRPGSRPG
jgi:ribose 5-phosphate isomerase A